MRKGTIDKNRRCPKCRKIENQIKARFNRSGTQRCKCKDCGMKYALEPKKYEYPKETKELAMKLFYSGISGFSLNTLLSDSNTILVLTKFE